MTRYRALLFDIGEVVSAAPWPVLDLLADATGREFIHRGPNDPDHDPIWQRYLSGEISYIHYWVAVATAAGYHDWKDFYRDVGHLPVEHFTDPDAAALIADAHAAGLKIGALTNEGAAINGMAFFPTVPELAAFDVFVDAAEFGERKPAPSTYLRAAEALAVPPDQIVFLDDTPLCVWGADEVGMRGVHVDPADRKPAFDLVRQLVGLAPASATAALVDRIARAEAERDVDAILAMYDSDVIVVRNGQRIAVGREEARLAHTHDVEHGADAGRELRVSMRLRAESAGSVALEVRRLAIDESGSRTERAAGEFWTLRRGNIVERRSYEIGVDPRS